MNMTLKPAEARSAVSHSNAALEAATQNQMSGPTGMAATQSRPRLFGWIVGLTAPVRARMRQQREYERLGDLPDYLLDDIGVSRTQARRRQRWTSFWDLGHSHASGPDTGWMR